MTVEHLKKEPRRWISGYPITIEIASKGEEIPIRERLEDPDHYKGPASFQAVIDFGSLAKGWRMRGQHVDRQAQWSAANLPPKGITILEFQDPRVKTATRWISEIAEEDFCPVPLKCQKYYDYNRNVFHYIRDYYSGRNSGESPQFRFLGLVRAGLVAGEMLGFPASSQVLAQTKRLHLRGEREGDIAVGISYLSAEDPRNLDGVRLLIADPAGATYSSVIANLVYLTEMGVRPKKVDIWNTVASHQGALFALDAMKDLNIEGEIVAGGYSPGMNRNYYLETRDYKPSVRDAGDGLNQFLPQELRL
ncbi:MAG: hypothetical protein AAB685_00445 [Patescibacteria group bacterium]